MSVTRRKAGMASIRKPSTWCACPGAWELPSAVRRAARAYRYVARRRPAAYPTFGTDGEGTGEFRELSWLGLASAARPLLFGRDTHVSASAGRLVVGSTERFELDVYDEAALQMRVVASVDLAPVTQTEVDAWLRVGREQVSEMRQEASARRHSAKRCGSSTYTPPFGRRPRRSSG